MEREIPFVPNEPDDLHCMQAAYLMIAKFFDPSFNKPMAKWSKITCFDKSTWQSAGLLWFKSQGYDVHHISLFDFPEFIKSGGEYLRKEYGDEAADWQIAHSNIAAEQKRAQELLGSGIVQQREPTRQDIENYLAKDCLIRAMVNPRRLNHKPGYVGHAVVIFDCDKTGVTLHDPGLPPIPNRKVSWQDLEFAMASPNKKSKELDAIKLI